MAAQIPTQTQCNACTLSFVERDGLEEGPVQVVTRAEKRLLVELLLLTFPGLKLAPKYSNEQSSGSNSRTLAEFREILLELRKERRESSGLV